MPRLNIIEKSIIQTPGFVLLTYPKQRGYFFVIPALVNIVETIFRQSKPSLATTESGARVTSLKFSKFNQLLNHLIKSHSSFPCPSFILDGERKRQKYNNIIKTRLHICFNLHT